MKFRYIDSCYLDKEISLKGVDCFSEKGQQLFFDDSYMLGCFDDEFKGALQVYDDKVVYFIGLKENNQAILDALLKKAKAVNLHSLSCEFVSAFDFTISSDYDFKSYDEAYEFIDTLKKRVYGLEHFKRYMDDMVNPQLRLKTIHVGGTNGKGSTVNYIRSVLERAGYKVGTFTSPPLNSRLEVIRVNNQSIPEKEMLKYVNRYMNQCLAYDLSMFEIEVFVAVMYFLEQGVDYAVFEVGLGGELDATNIISPLVSAITNIGLDHCDLLGDSYEEIATTKAGIIKAHTAFITTEKNPVCLDIFKQICAKHHSPMIKVDEVKEVKVDKGLSFSYQAKFYRLSTLAPYQSENASLAIEILNYLRDYKDVCFSDDDLSKGLLEAHWAGRFEVMREDPLLIIDGAHNKEGIEAFCQGARQFKHIKVIFSALKDKDTHGMIERLLELTDDITICEFDHYRAQSAQLLAEDFPVKIEKDWHQAIDEAFDYQGVLFITGSLYFISPVRSYIQAKLSK